MNLKKILLIALLLASAQAHTQTLPWQQMEMVGEAKLNFLFWPVYDARLFSEAEFFSFPDTIPFALAIEYKRDFSSSDMVAETRRQWQAIGLEIREDWLVALEQILMNVSRDDVLTLFVNHQGHSVFYFNDQVLGSIEDPLFSHQFSAIWLSEQSTRPGFRESLLRRNG